MSRYIKLVISYRFKPEGNIYEQEHYREVSVDECFQTEKSKLVHLFSNTFDKVVYLESIRTLEVEKLEYLAGLEREEAVS
ncbi:hypothetical protein EZE46_14770 [Bacillus sp. BH2]|uniref:hypothetical protein n=1 Tax=Bacillus sp. BH2 TaxID=2528958 RepID=UPI0010654275|nr:hypothetical protein [Bacillus sp. BH2]TEA49853.1 hypothetical protein EZE46_14770 [Bacillus sp. BH2]